MTIDIRSEDRAVFERLKSNGRITPALRRLITQQWNRCWVCNSCIPMGRPAFAGYDESSAPLYVGVCCGVRLEELAPPIYWSDSLKLSVPDKQMVWRYMSFEKFVALLREGGLYFARADKFDDPFEGATGLAAREADWDEFYLDYFRELVVTVPPGYPKPEYSPDQIEAKADRLLKSIKHTALDARKQLVSCWHINDSEAESLWRLYCPLGTAGVAIKSTIGKLWDACAGHDGAIVGRVQYLDYQRTFASAQNERIFQKRKSLSHENEARIVLQNERKNPMEGKVIICDLNSLISEVVASPSSPCWFLDLLPDVIQKYGYTFEVRRSELLEEPFF